MCKVLQISYVDIRGDVLAAYRLEASLVQAPTGKEKARKNPFLTDRFASDVDIGSSYLSKTLFYVIENRAIRSRTREERLTSPCYSLSHKAANIHRAVSRTFGNSRRAMKCRKFRN